MRLRKADRYVEIQFSEKTGYPKVVLWGGIQGEEAPTTWREWNLATAKQGTSHYRKLVADKLATGWIARGGIRQPGTAKSAARSTPNARPRPRSVAAAADSGTALGVKPGHYQIVGGVLASPWSASTTIGVVYVLRAR